jgi:hypothetical protein
MPFHKSPETTCQEWNVFQALTQLPFLRYYLPYPPMHHNSWPALFMPWLHQPWYTYVRSFLVASPQVSAYSIVKLGTVNSLAQGGNRRRGMGAPLTARSVGEKQGGGVVGVHEGYVTLAWHTRMYACRWWELKPCHYYAVLVGGWDGIARESRDN